MSPEPLPQEIEVTETPGGAHYRLPGRALGAFRLLGLLPLGFGLFFAGFAVSWMVGAAFAVLAGGFDWFGLCFVLFGVPFVLVGLWIMRLGILVLAGHSEVQLANGQLRAIERAGPIRWSRRRAIDGIRRLAVGSGAMRINGRPVESGPLSDMGGICVECAGSKPMLLAPGYPRSWLKPLADDLARRCQVAALESPEKPSIQVVEKHEGDEEAEPVEKPAGSSVVLEEHADGVTLQVPPAGLFRGSGGLFFFSLLWNGFMTVFTSFFLFAVLFGDAGGDLGGSVIFVLFITAFWAIGVGLLLGGINMGKRRAVLGVVGGDTLLVMQTGIFGSKRHEWRRDQIADIRAGPSGMESNNVPIIELQVLPKSGKKLGLLAGRDNDELHWMAGVLRRALQLPGVSGEW